MRGDNDGGKSELSRETSQDDDTAPGGGAEKSPLRELTDEDIQAEFGRDNFKGLDLLDRSHRERLHKRILTGGKWILTPDEVADAYQDMMKGICKMTLFQPGTIENIVGYCYGAAWKRGAGALRHKVRLERRKRVHHLEVLEASNRMKPLARWREDDDRLDTFELMSRIRNHLNELEGIEADVADCRFGDAGLTVKETATQLGLSVAEVKRISINIYRKLRTQLLEVRT